MYLHLGQETVVRTQTIIGIFDIENASLSKYTKSFLANSTKQGQVFNVSYEMPKSFIVCQQDGKVTVYVSQISTQTLLKRAKQTEERRPDRMMGILEGSSAASRTTLVGRRSAGGGYYGKSE